MCRKYHVGSRTVCLTALFFVLSLSFIICSCDSVMASDLTANTIFTELKSNKATDTTFVMNNPSLTTIKAKDFSIKFNKAYGDVSGLTIKEKGTCIMEKPVYSEKEITETVRNNVTGLDETIKHTESVLIGYKNETYDCLIPITDMDSGKSKEITFSVTPIIKPIGKQWGYAYDWIPCYGEICRNDWAWVNGSWGYRRAFNISETWGKNLINAQTNYTFNFSIEYLSGKINADCSDLRIANSSDAIILYWIELCNVTGNGLLKVWLKNDFVASTNTTFYAYYGNPTAISASDGNSVFDFFDDFNDGIIDGSKWNNWRNGTRHIITENNGLLNITGDASTSIGAIQQFAYPKTFGEEVKLAITGTSDSYWTMDARSNGGSTVDIVMWSSQPIRSNTYLFVYNNGASTAIGAFAVTNTSSQFNKYVTKWNKTYVEYWQNDVLIRNQTTGNIPDANLGINFDSSEYSPIYVNYTYARQFIGAEPIGYAMLDEEVLPSFIIEVQSPLNQTYGGTVVWGNITLNKEGTCDLSINEGTNLSMTNSTGNFNLLLPSLAFSTDYNVTFYCNDTESMTNYTTVYFSIIDANELLSQIYDYVSNIYNYVSSIYGMLIGWVDAYFNPIWSAVNSTNETLHTHLDVINLSLYNQNVAMNLSLNNISSLANNLTINFNTFANNINSSFALLNSSNTALNNTLMDVKTNVSIGIYGMNLSLTGLLNDIDSNIADINVSITDNIDSLREYNELMNETLYDAIYAVGSFSEYNQSLYEQASSINETLMSRLLELNYLINQSTDSINNNISSMNSTIGWFRENMSMTLYNMTGQLNNVTIFMDSMNTTIVTDLLRNYDTIISVNESINAFRTTSDEQFNNLSATMYAYNLTVQSLHDHIINQMGIFNQTTYDLIVSVNSSIIDYSASRFTEINDSITGNRLRIDEIYTRMNDMDEHIVGNMSEGFASVHNDLVTINNSVLGLNETLVSINTTIANLNMSPVINVDNNINYTINMTNNVTITNNVSINFTGNMTIDLTTTNTLLESIHNTLITPIQTAFTEIWSWFSRPAITEPTSSPVEQPQDHTIEDDMTDTMGGMDTIMDWMDRYTNPSKTHGD